MKEIILLRTNPKLAFKLNESNFKIIDEESNSNQGIYTYKSVKAVNFKKENINWFITAWSYLFGILTESGTGNSHKDKAHLKITLKNKSLKIWLFNIDIANIQELTHKMNKRITLARPTSQNI